MINKYKFGSNDTQTSIYLGWRGFGSLLGTRYYLNIEENVVKIISSSLFKGMEAQIFPASAILCINLYKPSYFYLINGAMLSTLNALSQDFARGELSNTSFIDILFSFILGVIITFVIEQMYERPRIEFHLEGGKRFKMFIKFQQKLPEVIQLIEKARGCYSSQNITSFHYYYTKQARRMS